MLNRRFRSVIVITLLLAGCLVWPPFLHAAPQAVEIKGVGYNVESAFEDNLRTLVGRKVHVTMDSGKEFAGTVKSVGTHLLHLEKIEGKEYFDALIRLERIEAVDTRFRELKR